MAYNPTGLVAFLFTDLAESTRLWEQFPERMPDAYLLHDALIRAAVTANHGVVYKVIGDAFQIAFLGATPAVNAALAAQRALTSATWPTAEPLRVRMALHLCPAEPNAAGDYRSPNLNRLGRLLAAGYGGQVLLSEALVTALAGELPTDVQLIDLGAHRLRDLRGQERIGQLVADGLRQQFPPLKTLERHSHNLDPDPTPFIGREPDVAQLAELLRHDQRRFLTITGPGGVGKTRLSREVTRRVAGEFADGVWWVSLAALFDAEAMVAAIAARLGLREVADDAPLSAITSWLVDRDAALVLDNLEQIAGAAAPLAGLLESCPQLRIMATSRSPIRLAGEREIALAPLPVPPSGSVLWTARTAGELDAVRLFVERARAVRAEFVLTDEQAPWIVAICRRLDGLPLAIELAAARVRLLSPAALLARLDPVLPLLIGGASDLPDRQRTMRGAIAWSVALLPEPERQLFARLAIFVGGAGLAAAEAIAAASGAVPPNNGADPLEQIEYLAAQSLLRIVESGSEPRLQMLETIREYALELLHAQGDEPALRSLHARWFLDRALEEHARFGGADETAALDRIERDHENFRAALTWLTAHDPGGAVQLANVLAHLWENRAFYRDGRLALRPVLALTRDVPPTGRARLLAAMARLVESQGDYSDAAAMYEESRQIARACDDTVALSSALEGLGGIAQDQGRFDEAVRLHEEMMAICARAGNEQGRAHGLLNLGTIAAIRGDVTTARERMEEALQILRRLDNQHGVAASLTNLGTLAFESGDVREARILWEEALAIWRSVNSPSRIALAMANLGEAAMFNGEPERAATYLRQAHDLHRDVGDRRALAVDLAALGYSATIAGDALTARRVLAEAFFLARETENPVAEAFAVETMAMIAVRDGHGELAGRLIGAADQLRTAHEVPRPPVYRPAHDQTIAATNALIGTSALQAAMAAGAAFPPESLIDQALQIQ